MGRTRSANSGADGVPDASTDPLQDGEEETPPPPPLDYLTADTSEDDWQEVGSERTYCPQPSDIGRCLKLEIRVLNPDGSLFFGPRLTETEPVLSAPPPPPQRPLMQVKNLAAAAGGLKFRIATYNILAEIYATQTMYPYCDHWTLNWNYRKVNLLREMREVAADVLFLQEVQADHYEQDILPELSEEGYDGLYKHKTRESMGASGKVDGCAILWRRGKFRLAGKESEKGGCAHLMMAG
jgi:CCR4-NOT transcription complex subunit 6